jgi:hypothetical protein
MSGFHFHPFSFGSVHNDMVLLFCCCAYNNWGLNDRPGPCRRHGLPCIPYALEAAMTMLRASVVPEERWVLFVHMGGWKEHSQQQNRSARRGRFGAAFHLSVGSSLNDAHLWQFD